LNGGDKDWGRYPPYRELGYEAAQSASADCALGSVGAGLGANTVNLKGGVGSASTVVDGITLGALAAVNAAGSVTIGDSRYFWAAAFEQDKEFGGAGLPDSIPAEALEPRFKGSAGANTTLVVVACDAVLSKAQARRIAVMAQTGVARAVYPVHTPLDGDVLFAVTTGRKELSEPLHAIARLGAVAANVTARAIARAVYQATAVSFPNALPSWKAKFGD
jgi:D-aminopeptidase